MSAVILRVRDFEEIKLLGSWVKTLVSFYGSGFVGDLYRYDSEHIEGSSLLDLRGLRKLLDRVCEHYVGGGEFYPYDRLVGLVSSGVMGDIEGWLGSQCNDFHAGMSKDDSLNVLGRLIGETRDEKIRAGYVQLFFQATGLTQAGISIDNSSKTVVLESEKKLRQAEELASGYRHRMSKLED